MTTDPIGAIRNRTDTAAGPTPAGHGGIPAVRRDYLHGTVGGFAGPAAHGHPSRIIPTAPPAHRDRLAAASTTAGRRAWLAELTTGWWPDPPEDQTSGLVHAERLVGATGLLFGAARTASALTRAGVQNSGTVLLLPRLRWELIVDAA